MENKKDLSRDFAIIFGIKPEEVPSNSSGNIRQLIEWNKRLLEKLYPSYPEVIERLAQISVSAVIEKSVEACETKENPIKARSNELKQYSEMENSKLKDTSTLKGVCNVYENKNEVKGRPQDRYQVNFKDDKSSINITESMFVDLMVNKDTTNLNGHKGAPNLLMGLDEDTGEMICLDSSSILSITKVK